MLVDSTCFQRHELSLVLAIGGEKWVVNGERGQEKSKEKRDDLCLPLVVMWREREAAKKVRNNGMIYNPSLVLGDSNTRDLTESVCNGRQNLMSHSLPSHTHAPCTYPWGYKMALSMRLQNKLHEDDEQTYKKTLTALQHQDNTTCEPNSHLPPTEAGAVCHGNSPYYT